MDPKTDAYLWKALGLGDPPPGRAPVVAVVGGGGKTTLVYRLAAEAAAMGRRAVVTGTTRFTLPEPPLTPPPLVQAAPANVPMAVVGAWAGDPRARCLVAAGAEPQPAGRLDPLPPEAAQRLRALPGMGLVAVEADGSKMRPFKAPAEHEPVIPGCATHVVAVVGAEVVGAALSDRLVHRAEQVRALLGRHADDEGPLSAGEVAAVLAHPGGGRKDVAARPFTVVVNKAEAHPEQARALGVALQAAGVARVILASLRAPGTPVHRVLT
jgi:molybdenum cofactor cytidylyltransferase